MNGAAQDLSTPARAGRIGATPEAGAVSAGVGSWFMGLGRPRGRCLDRRHRRPTVGSCTPADLRGAPANRRRTSVYSPATCRGRPATNCRCSLSAGGHFSAYWPAPWRCGAATNCGASAARNRRCSGTAPDHFRSARLRVLCRPSRPGLRDDRPRMVAWWLREWRLRGGWSGCGDRSFWPCRDRIYRNAWGLAHSALPLGQHMAWGALRQRAQWRFRRLARRPLRRLARWGFRWRPQRRL
jgi:hypothetical protein